MEKNEQSTKTHFTKVENLKFERKFNEQSHFSISLKLKNRWKKGQIFFIFMLRNNFFRNPLFLTKNFKFFLKKLLLCNVILLIVFKLLSDGYTWLGVSKRQHKVPFLITLGQYNYCKPSIITLVKCTDPKKTVKVLQSIRPKNLYLTGGTVFVTLI